MIIFDSTFPAAERLAGYPLARARIAYASYTRDLSAAAVTVSSETADGPKDAPLRPETWEFWEPSALSATWTLDFGADLPVDYVAIIAHTLGSKGVTVTAALESGSPLTFSTFVHPHSPDDDSPILFLGPLRVARRLRLTFSGGVGSPAPAPRIGVIQVGEVLKMEYSVQAGHAPVSLSRETVLTQQLSRTGQFLGQSFRRHGVSGNASFMGLSASWYRTYFEPFVQEARSKPFLFAWNPENYPDELAYVWLTDDVTPSQQFADMVNVSIRMSGIGNE